MKKMKNTKATREPQYSFGEEIQSFIDHIDSLVNTLPLVVGNIESRLIDNSKKMDKFLGKRSKKDKEEGKYYEVKVDEMNEFEELLKNIKSAEIAYKLLPKNFIVSLVSQYDAYLGCLIRTMYYAKPELTQTIDKSIKYSDLLSFKTVDEIKEEIIEKDVESVLRENHYQQLKCLEYRISNDRKNLP